MRKFNKINYQYLQGQGRLQENYNFHKAASILADYGFNSIRLNDDFEGSDFLAVHKDGSILKIQLKGRFTLGKKYVNKDLHIAFFDVERNFYLFLYDSLLEKAKSEKMNFLQTPSWKNKGGYS